MHHPLLRPAILSTLCSSLKALGMVPVRAALPGQERRLQGGAQVQQPPSFIFLPSFTDPAKTPCSLAQPLEWQQYRQGSCKPGRFPPLVAVLPPVVLKSVPPQL